MIHNILDIQKLVKSGFSEDWKQFGNVSVKSYDNLRLFNYTAKAQFGNEWNFFEIVSRGLIISTNGEVVARPFDKFFNWGQNSKYSNAPMLTVTEKLDGSLGILYRHNGLFCVATRGSFTSDQALWATQFLRKNYNLTNLPDNLTLLFEIIYPGNRVVLDYGDREDLVLLGARHRTKDNYLSFRQMQKIAKNHDFSLPKVFHFDNPQKIIEAAKKLTNAEGWVVKFADGQYFKFKGNQYLELHKLISGLSYKKVLHCISNGTYDELLLTIPDEFLSQVKKWEKQIQAKYNDLKNYIEMIFHDAPKNTRKEFALWVNDNHRNFASFLFARFDNRPLTSLIYKSIEKEEIH